MFYSLDTTFGRKLHCCGLVALNKYELNRGGIIGGDVSVSMHGHYNRMQTALLLLIEKQMRAKKKRSQKLLYS